jgi:GAF domain-containing protein
MNHPSRKAQEEVSSVERKPRMEASEAERQAAVDRTAAARRRSKPLQYIVEAAARDYGVPIALVSIIDRRREFFAARTGTDLDQVPRADALCLHAVRCPGEPVVALDTRADRRFANNPFVTGPPYVRFYAGVPLLDRAGYALGALCVIDTKPRAAAPSLFNLIRLAREAERLIDR